MLLSKTLNNLSFRIASDISTALNAPPHNNALSVAERSRSPVIASG
ncbi:MAG: hypothetical protein LBN27_09445 [Prevotellaceae bacterium]|nr:hypothetical protein [Prevotellaceae bacterium]